jgi:hypothetical protein
VAQEFVDNDFLDWGNAFEDHNIDLSFSIHVFPDGSTNTGYIVSKWASSVGFALRRSTTPSQYTLFLNSGSGGNIADTSPGVVGEDQWQNLIGTYDDSGSDGSCVMTLYKNNSSVASSSTADRIDANAITFGIGNRADLLRDFDGKLAEFAVWRNHLLTATQRQMLSDGFSPLLIRPLPTLYVPLVREINDITGGIVGTNTGAVAASSHPRVIYPTQPIPGFDTAAAPPAGISIPVVYHHRQRNF